MRENHHAAVASEKGINALDAMMLTFHALNALREHIDKNMYMHGIITKGGAAPNVVPDKVTAFPLKWI